MRHIGVLIAVALVAAACATDAPDLTPGMTRISISAASPQGWTVLYALPEPATELVFARQPDDSRTTAWKPGPGFEIVRNDNLERLRRVDGATFQEASVVVPPAYRDLPMDYGPFSPFGDVMPPLLLLLLLLSPLPLLMPLPLTVQRSEPATLAAAAAMHWAHAREGVKAGNAMASRLQSLL